MMEMDEALDLLLSKICQGCGAQLPVPGVPCESCGRIPAVTRPELEETLSGPGALAAVEARELRAQADRHAEQITALTTRADEIEHLAVLAARRDKAQRTLADAYDAEQEAATALKTAHQASQAAAADHAHAQEAVHDAGNRLERAQRMREGVQAEIDAEQWLAASQRVASRYAEAAGQAAEAKARAQQALTRAQAEVTRAEAEQDAAVAAVENPGRIPVSWERVYRDLLRVAADPSRTAVENALVGVLAKVLVEHTGELGNIVADTRQAVEKELAAKRAANPLLGRAADGHLTAVLPSSARGTT